MKPRTKLQFHVLEHSRCLRDIGNHILEWAKSACFDHEGYATKTRVICLECGQRFSPELVTRKRAVCPHCSGKLTIRNTRKRKNSQSMYIAKAEVHDEFQVIRNFLLHAHYAEDREPRYYVKEVLQHWIKDDGSREVVARIHPMGNLNSWTGDLEIRKKTIGGSGYYNYGPNDVYPWAYHPNSEFRPVYTRYGINARLQGLSFLRALRILPYDSKAETLLKAKQYELLSYCESRVGRIETYWPSIKICLRNKYKIKDVSMWFDYLQLLERYGKDLRNAHYVCPKNLHKAHDTYMKKKARDDEKERRERDKQKMLKLKEAAENYIKDKSKFFDLQMSDGKIVIVVLKSVDEFMLEGEKMHHCVFTNEYFKKKDCLILSARIDNKRVETVELNLKTLQVVQSRGVCNKNTEYHDRIVGLVRKNINLIRQKIA